MSQSIPTSPQLHDIPLTGDEQGDADKQKISTSKTNSLKRFFKLPHKKTSEPMPPATSDALLETAKEEESPLSAAMGVEKPKELKRFQLRLGLSKYDTTSPVSPAGSCSKSTLKGSISSYLNNVFKRSGGKKNANSSRSNENDAEANDEDADVDEETVETEQREDVHSLPISDDCLEEIPQQELRQLEGSQ